MGSASLREACEAVIKNNSMPDASQVMTAVCQRAVAIQSDMRYWDLVSIVQASAASKTRTEEIETISELIRGKLSHLSPKHIIDLIASFESLGIRPKALYKDLFHRLVNSVESSMYIDELIALLRVLARNGMQNEIKFLDSLSLGIMSNDGLLNQMRILHCCEVVGALSSLERLPDRLVSMIEHRVAKELMVVPLDELWKTVTGFSQLIYSFQPFEKMTTDRLESVVSTIEPVMFDQVTAPMEFLQFIRIREWLTPEVVIAACKWANDAVYRPATRTEAHRRPTIFEVALLADLCREMNIPIERVEKAIKITVTSKGGTVTQISKPKPLRYRKRRAYIREADGYKALGVMPINDPKLGQPSVIKSNEAAFAPKLRNQSGDVPLWKSRSGPWFHRK